MASGEPEDLEPGLARERTRLAWARTAIAFATVGAVMLRRELAAGVIVLAGSPLIWALGRLTTRQAPPEPLERRSRRLLLVTAVVTAVAALAAIAALFGSSPASLHDLLPLHG